MAFLILVLGDIHIPDRALDFPAKVRAPPDAAVAQHLLGTAATHYPAANADN